MEESLKYFNGDDFRATTWMNKYALKDDFGNKLESSPKDMFKRLAKEFARIEEKYISLENRDNLKMKLSDYGYQRHDLDEEAIHSLFDDFRYIILGGSGLATIGSGQPVSASNCFVIASPEDSITGINKTSCEQQNLMKRRGGVGHDLSKIRPRGTKVNNSALTSSGVVPFMNLFSEATNTIAQEGRRGALMLSINIDHPDSPEFIKAKQDLTKVTGANISVKVTNEFMEAVQNDEDYILRYPIDADISNIDTNNMLFKYNTLVSYNYSIFHNEGDDEKEEIKTIYIKKVKAKEVWDSLMHCAWNTAEPGIIFEDTMVDYSPDGVYDKFRMVSTNPCVTKDTTLLTKDGFVPIIDLIDQDVDIWNGFEWTKVKPFKTSDSADIYLVELSDGDSIKCTKYHKFILKDNIRKELKDVKVGDKLAKFEYPVIKGDDNYSDSLYKEFYTRGFFCGDGTIAKEEGRSDRYFIDLYDSKKELFKYLNAEIYGSETDSKQRVILNSKYDKDYVPNENDNLKLRLAYLAGIIDSDGTLNDKGGSIAISSNSNSYLYRIKSLLISLGCRSSIGVCKEAQIKNIKGIDYNCDTNYRLVISAYYVKQLMDLGLTTNRVELIANPNRNASRFITVDKITKLEHKQATYCVTDNKNHSAVFNHTMTGQCGEIPMGPYDSCRLIHLNMSSFIDDPYTKDAKLNDYLLYKMSYEATRLADDLIDLEVEAIDRILDKVTKDEDAVEIELWSKIKDTTLSGRRAGLGFTALADAIAMLGLKFDSNKGLNMIRNIMRIKFKAELDCQIDMAITRGSFPDWDEHKEYKPSLEGELSGRNSFFQFLYDEFKEQVHKMYRFGRRNVSWSTVAPTGTVSILAGTSSGIEPVFMLYYSRRRKIMNDSETPDYIDKIGEKYKTFNVIHPLFQEWAEVQNPKYTMNYLANIKPEELDKICKSSPWYGSTAPEIDWRQRIRIQGIVQKYTTHSISSTVNLPKETILEEIADIYTEAWKTGNKGQTIYRDGSREGILNSVDSNEEGAEMCSGCPAPKRPKELVADYHTIKVKGETFIVLIGLYKDKPYEIFAFKPLINFKVEPHQGIITKVKKMHYKFESDYLEIPNLQLTSENEIEKSITLFGSMLLRHGIDIRYIIKTAQKINPIISSFSSAVCRILSKYRPNEITSQECPDCGGKLLHEAGCIRCLDCDYSQCL